MNDSELSMIETMLKKQDELNSAIMKEYGLTTISKEQIESEFEHAKNELLKEFDYLKDDE